MDSEVKPKPIPTFEFQEERAEPVKALFCAQITVIF